MKRLMAAFFLLVGLVWWAGPAAAHSLSLVAAVSTKANEVTVRLLDPYGAKVQGGTVTATPSLPGKTSGKSFPLAEGPEGTYHGLIAPPGGSYDLMVEASLGPDLFRSRLTSRQSGEDTAELLVPMQPVEVQQGFSWGPILYLAAVVVLVTATAVAVLRKRSADDGVE